MNSLLPSYMRRNTTPAIKKKVKVQTWNKDVVCLPQSVCNYSSTSMGISYPRGRLRAQLGSMGLIGKLHLKMKLRKRSDLYLKR